MRTIFDTLVEHAHDAMESQNKDVNTPEALRKTERDLDIALADCKAVHNTMLELLDYENVEKEIEWIRNMHARQTINRQLCLALRISNVSVCTNIPQNRLSVSNFIPFSSHFSVDAGPRGKDCLFSYFQ